VFEKILVPLDGSAFAEAALPYAEYLGEVFQSELILLHVCGQECRNNESVHKSYLNSIAETLAQRAKFNVTTQTEHGNPLETIGLFVEKNNINLIILTSAGTSGHKGDELGSVADHISRTVKVPALLIKSREASSITNERPSIQHVLVPLDGSDVSRSALPIAVELAQKLKIPLTIFQMARTIYPYYGEAAPFVDYDKLTDDENLKVRAEMSSLKEEYKLKGQMVEWAVTSGNDAAHEIIEMSKKLENCIVIMSTHGRSGLGRWALGSVAEKVLRQIEAPLLLAPARSERAS